MVFSESLSVFTGFKEGGSQGILPHEKLNVHNFRNFISGILAGTYRCCHHNTHIQIEINKACKKLTLPLFKLLKEVQLYLATKFLQGV